jgi:type II secretory pathway component PulF
MPLITTPRQLIHKADLFYQLSQMTASGIGLIQALEVQHASPPSRSLRLPIGRILDQLRDGATFSESLHAAPGWIATFDLALLHAAETSGRLPAVLDTLARYYRDRADLMRSFLGSIAYPVFVLHVAILIFPITILQDFILQGKITTFMLQKTVVLAPLYLLAFLAMILFGETRGHGLRAALERVLRCIPLLGSALHQLALARLATALESLLSAGAPVIESWELAADASGSPAIQHAVLGFKPRLRSGDTPAELVRQSPQFPEMFANQYASGEISGKLDETLRWLYRHFQEEGNRKLRNAIKAAGGIIFMGVVLLVAWQVISFYIGYFNQIQQVMP